MLGAGFQDPLDFSPLGPQPAERERDHDIIGGTQNPKFRQMSNHRRVKLAGALEIPWSVLN